MSRHPVYVALGDSISIDDYAGGPGRGGPSLLSRNRDDDFPDWRGRDLATRWPGLEFHPLATDGGTTATLLDVQLPRLEALDVAPDIVSLTVGGNDVLSAYGDTRTAVGIVREVRARVATAIAAVARLMAPGGAIVVGNVYDPSDGTADAAQVGLPPWPDVVEVLRELNAGLADVAEVHAAVVADIHGTFLGHGLSVGNPAQTQARPPNHDLWYCHVIEPNAWGANGVRAALWEALYPG